MRTSRRSRLAAALVLAGGLGLGASPARAQIGTYEDFPFQQGSLFYRPGGNPISRRAYSAPRRAPAPTYYYVPQAAPAPYYTVPGGGAYYLWPQYPPPYLYQYPASPGLFRPYR